MATLMIKKTVVMSGIRLQYLGSNDRITWEEVCDYEGNPLSQWASEPGTFLWTTNLKDHYYKHHKLIVAEDFEILID